MSRTPQTQRLNWRTDQYAGAIFLALRGNATMVLRRPATGHLQRRATLRHDVSVRGKIIVSGFSSWTLGCLVVDLSLGGARVTLDEHRSLPEKVMLFEAHQQNIYECDVRW